MRVNNVTQTLDFEQILSYTHVTIGTHPAKKKCSFELNVILISSVREICNAYINFNTRVLLCYNLAQWLIRSREARVQ